MKAICVSVVLSVSAAAASAAILTVEDGKIHMSGDINWSAGTGYIDPVRSSSTYTFELPLEGTPFDPEFRPPPAVRQQVPPIIGHGLPVSIGDPQTRNVQRDGEVSAYVFNWDGPRYPVLRPDNAAIEPQPVLTDNYIGLGGLRYVTDGPNGTSNVTDMNFFLNFNEDFSQILSVSATQVIESSIFVPLAGGDTVTELGVLVAVGTDEFDPIDVRRLD